MKSMFLVMASVSLLLSGCASVIKGTSQTLTVTSEPGGAKVMVDGQELGVTPLTLKLKKNKYDTLMVQKKGFITRSRPLEKSFDPVAVVNIFWDLSTTDLLTGAVYEYEPSSYHFALEQDPEAAAVTPAAPAAAPVAPVKKWLPESLERNYDAEVTAFVLQYFYQLKGESKSELQALTRILSQRQGKPISTDAILQVIRPAQSAPELVTLIKAASF